MFDFHEKRRLRSVLYSKTVFFLLIVIAVSLSISVYNRLIVAQETKERLSERKEDLEALEMRADVLRSRVDYLENERGIEEELRNRFDVAKEGEQVVVILEDKDKKREKSEQSTDKKTEEDISVFKSVLNLLKFW